MNGCPPNPCIPNPCPPTFVPGPPGQNSFSLLTNDFTLPASPGLAATNLFVSSTAWMMPGQIILVGDQSDGVATCEVEQVVSPTQASVTWIGATGDALGLAVMHVSNGAYAVPGGEPGVAGTAGINAYTILTGNLTVPADTATVVTALVADSQWVTVGQTVVVGNAIDGVGTFRVTSVPDATHISMTFLNAVGDVNFGSTLSVTNQSTVSPAGVPSFPGQRFMLTSPPPATTYQNSGTGQTNLMQDLVPAGQLKNAGDCLDVEAVFSLTNNGNTKTVTVAFGATTLITVTGAQALTGSTLVVIARIIRVSSTAELAYASATITPDAGPTIKVVTALTQPAEILSNALLLICTGQSSAATGDVIQRVLRSRYQPV